MADSPVILITGCNGNGLGHHLAVEALNAGMRVIATARIPDTVQDLEEMGASILALDITATTEAMKNFAEKALAIYGRIDALLNNAGQGGIGSGEEMPLEQFETIMNVNFYGTLKVTKAFLPHFRQQKSGTIAQISTRNVDLAMAGLSAYAASKAASAVFYDALHKELKPYGVRVISFQPGAIRTGMAASEVVIGSALYSEVHASVERFAASAGGEPGDPQKLAKRIVELVQRPGKLPSRFALGQQAFEMISKTVEERLESLREYEQLSIGLECDKQV